jgi:uncharacterized protein (DUF305 family)
MRMRASTAALKDHITGVDVMNKTILAAMFLAAAGTAAVIAQQPAPGGGMMQGGMRGSGAMQPGAMPGSQPGMMQQGMMQQGMMHQGMMHQGMAALPKGDRSPSSLAFNGINAKMHAAMDITFTGDADKDFAAGMIAHHEGAIDMAKVVLAFGKDAEMKKLADDIIKAQEKEVAWMKEWQTRKAK